jgi:hypothetical protein
VGRVAWHRLRSALVGQTAPFAAEGSDVCMVRITACLRNPAPGCITVIELVTEENLDWKMLPERSALWGQRNPWRVDRRYAHA